MQEGTTISNQSTASDDAVSILQTKWNDASDRPGSFGSGGVRWRHCSKAFHFLFFFLRFLLCFAFLSDENVLVQLDLRCCVSTANHITKSMVMRACAHFHFSHTHTRQPLLLRESIFAKCSGFRQDPFCLVLKGCFRRPEAILLTELHPRFFFIFFQN